MSAFSSVSLSDPRIVDLSRRIHIEVVDESDQEWQKTRPCGTQVTVRLISGETLTEIVPMLREMTAAGVDDKFQRLAAIAISEEKAKKLLELERNLETVSDVSLLAPLLTQ